MPSRIQGIETPRDSTEIHLPLLGKQVWIESTDRAWLADLTQGFEPFAADSEAKTPDLRIKMHRRRRAATPPAWEVDVEPAGGLDCVPQTPSVLISALNRWSVKMTTRHYVFHAGADRVFSYRRPPSAARAL